MPQLIRTAHALPHALFLFIQRLLLVSGFLYPTARLRNNQTFRMHLRVEIQMLSLDNDATLRDFIISVNHEFAVVTTLVVWCRLQ